MSEQEKERIRSEPNSSKLTTAEKIEALVDFGLAEDAEDARVQLVDMGEIQEDEA